jgi:UDP-2-acetamido-3-amino-2,3-dideoxy-glucuronate N-acetyltransferase
MAEVRSVGIHKTASVHHTAAVDENVTIGANTSIWHFTHVLPNANIGANCIIGQNVMIGSNVVIGNGCKIQNNVSVYTDVTLEDDVFCGPSMVFTNVLTPRAFVERKNEFAKTRVKKGATIGANATIVCGHDIGEYSMVGAGAVVTKEVLPYALVIGNPARRIGWVSRTGERLGPDLVCPRTGERYEEVDGRLRPVGG